LGAQNRLNKSLQPWLRIKLIAFCPMGACTILFAVSTPVGAAVGLGVFALVGTALFWSYRILKSPDGKPLNGLDADGGFVPPVDLGHHGHITENSHDGDCEGADGGDGDGGGD
jgi:hypothetical protein